LSGLIIIALVLLLLYGSDRLATVGKGLGAGVKAFRKTLREREPAPPPPRVVQITPAPPAPPAPPKLLPAKGETSRTEPPDPEGS